ncbi:ankyrin repeat-containing protein [Anaeramoeba flamelloides]|uniref:Ankyrin repeat-containing protein n=1 Tax=Anaeramoeba flamelloides TaxID=1746091 RepID=A0AAV7ZQP0_9EUKA|nr:ankyrin repeat-containing protein [Anaeramoeba flamelloides]
MEFWSKKKNKQTLAKAPKNVVIEFIKNNCDENPDFPIAELLNRRKYEQFWIRFGVEQKGSLKKRLRNGNNCLHFVITRSKLEESYEDVEYMLQNGVDPNQLNGQGFNSFHLLCQQPNLPIKFFELFFRYNADPNRLSNSRKQPMTPFSFLLMNDKYEDLKLWELFLQNGSNPFLMCDYNQRNFLSLLLSRTTLPKRSTIEFFIEHGYPFKQSTGYPLLSLLCNKNLDQDYLEFMLQIGAQINPKKTFSSVDYRFAPRTPLCVSILNHNLTNVKLLLKNGADPNLTCLKGMTPLHVAFSVNLLSLDLLKLLVDYRVDFNIKNEHGFTLLTLLFARYYYNFFPEEKEKHQNRSIYVYSYGEIRYYKKLLK